MISKSLGSVLALAVVLVLAGICAYAQTPVPTWPQQFSVKCGETVKFVFPVTSPGDVVVDVTWQGYPLTMVLADPSGKQVANVIQRPSPVKLMYSIVSADIQKGILWSVTITAQCPANASSQPVATGQINVKSPPANPQAVLTAENTMRQVIRSRTAFPTRLQRLNGTILTKPDPGLDTAVLDIKTFGSEAVSFWKGDSTKNDDYWQVNPSVPGEIDSVHAGGMFVGHYGNDVFFKGVTLKNGWVVDKVDFTPSSADSAAYAKILPGGSHIGAADASVSVVWSDGPPLQTVTYTLMVSIKGPKGTSWK